MKLKEKLKNKIQLIKQKHEEKYNSGYYKRVSLRILNWVILLDGLFCLIYGLMYGLKDREQSNDLTKDNDTIQVLNFDMYHPNYLVNTNDMPTLSNFLSYYPDSNIFKFDYTPANYESSLDVTIGSNQTYYVYLIREDGLLDRVNRLKPDNIGNYNPSVITTNSGATLLTNHTYWFLTNYTPFSPFGYICDTTYSGLKGQYVNKDLSQIVMNGLYKSSDLNPYCAIAPAPAGLLEQYDYIRFNPGQAPGRYEVLFFDGLCLINGKLVDKIYLTWTNCSYLRPLNFGESITDYSTYDYKNVYGSDYNYFISSMSIHYIGTTNGTQTSGSSTIEIYTNATREKRDVAYRNYSIIAPIGPVYSYAPLLRFYDYNLSNVVVLAYKNVSPSSVRESGFDFYVDNYYDLIMATPNIYGSNSTSLLGGLFGLISHAFTPIGYFMSLELAPGFYLGYIIFAPIVVACMIAIVKMLRS